MSELQTIYDRIKNGDYENKAPSPGRRPEDMERWKTAMEYDNLVDLIR